jgi:hypothetical protein
VQQVDQKSETMYVAPKTSSEKSSNSHRNPPKSNHRDRDRSRPVPTKSAPLRETSIRHMAAGQLKVPAPRTYGVGLENSKHGLARIVAVAHSKVTQWPFVQWFDWNTNAPKWFRSRLRGLQADSRQPPYD